ncbi:hypothetical protein C3L57_06875 [Veillonellaceae bacterium M2-8]|nr:hypothetical protein [Veillonellaceae bacterium M2-8]
MADEVNRNGHQTETGLCNMALSYLGKGHISNIDEVNQNARTCKLFYDITRQEVLRTFPWNFAHRIERLNEVSDTDKRQAVSKFSEYYIYPNKCINLIAVTTQGDDTQRAEFDVIVINGIKVIATDVSNAYVEYICDETNPNMYDSLFIVAFTHLLASKIAVQLTGMPQLEQAQLQAYMQAVQLAHLHDSRERRFNTNWKGSYLQARRG